jgi:catechol 2,3-dioxygenase-like lactoylglutathione lyase family enzyme
MDFRVYWFSAVYEASLAFYGHGLGLPVVESWDRGPEDRGTLFQAHTGRIEVLARPSEPPEESGWDTRPPQGMTVALEVEDVDARFRDAQERGLAIREPLTDQSWGHRSFILSDPDGISIYIYEDRRDPES